MENNPLINFLCYGRNPASILIAVGTFFCSSHFSYTILGHLNAVVRNEMKVNFPYTTNTPFVSIVSQNNVKNLYFLWNISFNLLNKRNSLKTNILPYLNACVVYVER